MIVIPDHGWRSRRHLGDGMIIGIVDRGDRADHPDPMSVRLICADEPREDVGEDALGLVAFASLVIRNGSSALLRGASIRP